MFSLRTLPVALAAALLALTCLPPILPGLAADDEVSATQPERKRKAPRPAAKRRAAEPQLREIHVAVLPIGATREVKIDPEALTDQVHVLMASLPSVTLVDRAEIDKVIQEQELTLTGLVDANRAVELGKLLSAQYILVGRASRVGESYYLVLRLIEVETTRQSLPLDSETLQRIEELRETLAPFRGLRFLVQVPESHVRSQIPDPAAQMMITHFLSKRVRRQDSRPGELPRPSGTPSDQTARPQHRHHRTRRRRRRRSDRIPQQQNRPGKSQSPSHRSTPPPSGREMRNRLTPILSFFLKIFREKSFPGKDILW